MLLRLRALGLAGGAGARAAGGLRSLSGRPAAPGRPAARPPRSAAAARVAGSSTTPAAAAPQGAAAAAGLSLSRPFRQLKFRWGRRPSLFRPTDVVPDVDVMLEGAPKAVRGKALERLASQLSLDAPAAVRAALLRRVQTQPGYKLPGTANLSLVLCDDAHIRALNFQHRRVPSSLSHPSCRPRRHPAAALPASPAIFPRRRAARRPFSCASPTAIAAIGS